MVLLGSSRCQCGSYVVVCVYGDVTYVDRTMKSDCAFPLPSPCVMNL